MRETDPDTDFSCWISGLEKIREGERRELTGRPLLIIATLFISEAIRVLRVEVFGWKGI